jgi:hypothetical protein
MRMRSLCAGGNGDDLRLVAHSTTQADGRAGIVWRYVTALSHDTGGGRQAGGAGTGGNRTLKVTEAWGGQQWKRSMKRGESKQRGMGQKEKRPWLRGERKILRMRGDERAGIAGVRIIGASDLGTDSNR